MNTEDARASRTYAQFQTGKMTEEQSTIPAAARPAQGQRAGLVTRAAASLIDLGIVIASAAGLWLAAWVAVLTLWPSDRAPDLKIGPFIAFGFLLLWVLWAVSWATSGRSPGGAIMGIRVVSGRGERLHAGPATLRAITCQLLPIGLLWILLSRENRSLQDVFFRTNVIYYWHLVTPRRPFARLRDRADGITG